MIDQSTTIVAPITASGGAVCVIRLSGSDSLAIVGKIFRRALSDRIAVFGVIHDGEDVVDEVVAVYYKSPRSYTGEDCIEISCHGSAYITNQIIRLLIDSGAVMATAGEFTLRAFLNGKMDLSQAEAVADMIASDSRASSMVALQQMRGGYSEELRILSDDLLNILSLLELELDFGEEDVEFADRKMMTGLISNIYEKVYHLSNSFRLGNVLKNGVPVAIVGKPNVGKSTLLNRLLGEERSIVSSIAGTTRDFIEEVLIIDGIAFRFIDTAGLRVSEDEIERIGIERSYEKLRNASVVLQLVESADDIEELHLSPNQKQIIVFNKCDLHTDSNKNILGASEDSPFRTPNTDSARQIAGAVSISAKLGSGIDELKERLTESIGVSDYDSSATVVSNSRHFEALEKSRDSFERAMSAINMKLPTDIISTEIRIALSHLGEITGKITTDDILGNIFSKFCIGK